MLDRTSPPIEKMPGPLLLSQLGKRVVRPGGVGLTRWLLDQLSIGPGDHVVEFGAGLGATTRLALARGPASYLAVERNQSFADSLARRLSGPVHRCLVGNMASTGLDAGSATVVFGEAVFTMQLPENREKILAEAVRLLEPGGRFGLHELCFASDVLDEAKRAAIRRELSDEIHAGIRPLSFVGWEDMLTTASLKVVARRHAPLRVLEPVRVLSDEGVLRMARLAWHLITNPRVRRRILGMRKVMRKYRRELNAVALVVQKPHGNGNSQR